MALHRRAKGPWGKLRKAKMPRKNHNSFWLLMSWHPQINLTTFKAGLIPLGPLMLQGGAGMWTVGIEQIFQYASWPACYDTVIHGGQAALTTSEPLFWRHTARSWPRGGRPFYLLDTHTVPTAWKTSHTSSHFLINHAPRVARTLDWQP